MARSRPLRVRLVLGPLLLTVLSPSSAHAQGPLDVFGSHFGAVRLPRLAPQSWLSGSFMLLTQLDGRWEDDSGAFKQYDGLSTSVGYNYVTAGHQWVLNNLLPDGTALTLAGSLHVGATKDSLVVAGVQTALHDFRNILHVFRPQVDDGTSLLGVDLQALVWPRRGRVAVGGHASLSTFHRELAAEATARLPFRLGGPWIFSPSLTAGLVGSNGIRPARVGARLDGGYWSARGTVEYAETLGFSTVWSEGIFEGEHELLLSGYFAARLSARNWLRVEFVNDLLGDKDRGPTGGGRIVWSIRY